MKAIKITADNRNMLANQFNHPDRPIEVEDHNDMLPIGYWLVCDFGSEIDYDLLTDGGFNEHYVLGEKINNGWYAVTGI